ncbi:MAG: DUF4837 family protein [Reichenbachiella sp.]
MSKVAYFIVLVCFSFFIGSCGSDGNKKDVKSEDAKAYLPKSAGAPNAIMVVMDTSKWNHKIGDALREVFSEYVEGLPREEPYFKIRNVNPYKFNSIIKRSSNVVMLYTLDDRSRQGWQMRKFFTDESLKKIAGDSSLFMLPQKNVYAKGQEVLHLFGQTEDQLIAKLRANKDRIRNHFIKIENDRISKSVLRVREKTIEKKLATDYDFTIKVPYGYDISKALKDFVWIRQLDPQIEKNIFIHFKPFDSEEVFDDVLAYRESITDVYMRDIEKPDIYMTLQDTMAVIREVNYNGLYAKQTRGLWKLSDISGGGPFVSYVFVDEKQKRVYYLEGYVYAPSKDKRALMQEMEVILSTFKSSLK